MKKTLIFLSAICLLLASCGNVDTTAPTSETTSTAKSELTTETTSEGNSETEIAFNNEVEMTPLEQAVADAYAVRGLKPGMSIDDVRAAEPFEINEDASHAIVTENGSIRYFSSAESVDYDERQCTVEYCFIDGKLSLFEYDTDIEYTADEYFNDGVGGFNAYSAKRLALSDKLGLPTHVDDDSILPSYAKLEFFHSSWTNEDENMFLSISASQSEMPSIYADSTKPMSDSFSIGFGWKI